jgi:hypothetical protein
MSLKIKWTICAVIVGHFVISQISDLRFVGLGDKGRKVNLGSNKLLSLFSCIESEGGVSIYGE